MIPIKTFAQFRRCDGWIADARPTHGFKLAESGNKAQAPRRNSTMWHWHNVHKTEVSRFNQTYRTPDLTDPIRCSYLTLSTTAVEGGLEGKYEYVVDVEPCRTFHDSAQQLHTLWVGRQELVEQALLDGSVAKALGVGKHTGGSYDTSVEQVYYDGRYLYNLPWPVDCDLTNDVLTKAGANPVNKAKTLWLLPLAVVSLAAQQDWELSVPRQHSSLLVYRSPNADSLWGHTPPLAIGSFTPMASLLIGDDGMDECDAHLTLNLDFALDAARTVGKWCGPAAVDALHLPRIMLSLNTVNLSNLHPSERNLTPIGMGFSHAFIWLMGRSQVCRTPEQCLDFRSLYTDLCIRRTCSSDTRLDVRRSKTAGQPIPLLDVNEALAAASAHVSKREQARQKRSATLTQRAKEAEAERAKEHAAMMAGRRTRRGGASARLSSITSSVDGPSGD